MDADSGGEQNSAGPSDLRSTAERGFAQVGARLQGVQLWFSQQASTSGAQGANGESSAPELGCAFVSAGGGQRGKGASACAGARFFHGSSAFAASPSGAGGLGNAGAPAAP